MFKRNKLHTALVVTSVALMSSAAVAETTSGTASVEITNAFSLVETTSISFGNLQLTNDTSSGTNGVVVVSIPGDANPMTLTAADPTEASGNILAQGNPAVFDVTGAAPFTTMTIDLSGLNAVTLTNSDAPPATPTLTMDLSGTDQAFVVGGANDGLDLATGDLVTDANGAVGLSLGGTLTSDDSATAVYADGTYSGSYNLTITY